MNKIELGLGFTVKILTRFYEVSTKEIKGYLVTDGQKWVVSRINNKSMNLKMISQLAETVVKESGTIPSKDLRAISMTLQIIKERVIQSNSWKCKFWRVVDALWLGWLFDSPLYKVSKQIQELTKVAEDKDFAGLGERLEAALGSKETCVRTVSEAEAALKNKLAGSHLYVRGSDNDSIKLMIKLPSRGEKGDLDRFVTFVMKIDTEFKKRVEEKLSVWNQYKLLADEDEIQSLERFSDIEYLVTGQSEAELWLSDSHTWDYVLWQTDKKSICFMQKLPDGTFQKEEIDGNKKLFEEIARIQKESRKE